MNKKVIWIINEYAGSKYHGMIFRHYYLAKELIKKGYDVYIITAFFSHLLKTPPKIEGSFTFEILDGINYLWVKVPRYKHAHDIKRALKWLVFSIKLFRLPLKNIKKPDVILVSPMAPFPIAASYRLSKKYNAKLIYEVRDIWPLTLIEIGGYSKYNLFIAFMQLFEDFAYKKADFVVSVLPNAMQHMCNRGMEPKKFNYIPNGIALDDLDETEPLDDNIKRLIPENKFIIGYTGKIGISNALERLVESAKILKAQRNIHFVIVGSGHEKERLLALVKKYSLENITFINTIPKSQVQSILRLFDVCYIGLKEQPLFQFGVSPNKLFDYMYSAKPILYAINSGNKPVSEADCGISVEAGNPEAIAEAILNFYRMPAEERKQMGENGKKYVLQNHTYSRLAENYIELIES